MVRNRKKDFSYESLENRIKNEGFGTMLSNSIKKAMNTQLLILGSVSIFFLLNRIINPQNIAFISGFLEISQGLNSLISLPNTFLLKKLLATFFISFGGLSIHLQIKGILSETDLSYFEFLKGRILQTILSLFLAFFL